MLEQTQFTIRIAFGLMFLIYSKYYYLRYFWYQSPYMDCILFLKISKVSQSFDWLPYSMFMRSTSLSVSAYYLSFAISKIDSFHSNFAMMIVHITILHLLLLFFIENSYLFYDLLLFEYSKKDLLLSNSAYLICCFD